MNVIRIIKEKKDEEIEYGMDKKGNGERNVIIFEIGGGKFDV
jgi:L1 cell adhesion molecule like protein